MSIYTMLIIMLPWSLSNHDVEFNLMFINHVLQLVILTVNSSTTDTRDKQRMRSLDWQKECKYHSTLSLNWVKWKLTLISIMHYSAEHNIPGNWCCYINTDMKGQYIILSWNVDLLINMYFVAINQWWLLYYRLMLLYTYYYSGCV